MKTISQLTDKDCIYCETEEEATAICKLLHKAGKKWSNGESYLKYNWFREWSIPMYHDMEWNMYNFVYYEDKWYTVHKAKDFISSNDNWESWDGYLQLINTFILIFVAAILSVLLFTPYTILISCDNWHIYERYWVSPLTEVKKLEKTLSTGDSNIDCGVEMFAR